MPKYLPVLTSQRLIWLAGLALITSGVVCLYLSDAVARPGSWWQGTLDAFGVGFTVGGIVDVVAISLITKSSLETRRGENSASKPMQSYTIT